MQQNKKNMISVNFLTFSLLLIAVCIFANLWFHFIKAVWNQIKKIFILHKDSTPTWHDYPYTKEKNKDKI